jgi:hypothetical protein
MNTLVARPVRAELMTDSGQTVERRPKSTWAQVFSTILRAFTAIAACIAIVSFWRSVKISRIQDAQESIAALYPLDASVNQALAQNPSARKCLYDDPDGVTYKQLSEEDEAVFKEACVTLGGVFEYYFLIRDYIGHHPKGPDITQSWNEYLRVVCQRSYGFRSQINSAREMWTKMFLAEFDLHTKDLPYDKDDR